MIITYQDTTYEPEIYSAVYIKIDKVTLIYYTTGSFITGTKKQEQIESVLHQFIARTTITSKLSWEVSRLLKEPPHCG